MKRVRILTLCLVAGVALVGFLIWSARTPGAAEAWMAAQRARGEKFTLAELGLDRVPPTTNLLADLIESSSGPLKQLAAAAVRGAKLPAEQPRGLAAVKTRLPVLVSVSSAVLDWTNATTALDTLRPVLQQLEAGLKEPPASSGLIYTNYYSRARTYNFVAVRSVGQGLHDAAMLELRRGNLSAALDHQLALLRLARAYGEDGLLITQMIRVAMAGLALDGVWQALQSPGWTEPQLASLQEELERLSVFPGFRHSLEVERAMLLDLMEQMIRNPDALRALMGASSPSETVWGRVFFGLWRSLWSDGDRLVLLQFKQEYLNALRAIEAGQPAPIGLRAGALASERLEHQIRSVVGRRYWFSNMAIPQYGRATETVLHNETLRRLGVIAVACERFRLREGHYPDQLEALEPTLLRAPVLDPFSGELFHYRRRDGGFLLYSVGHNGRDDGGDAALAPPGTPGRSSRGGPLLVWDGLDAVWPVPAPDPVPVDESLDKQ